MSESQSLPSCQRGPSPKHEPVEERVELHGSLPPQDGRGGQALPCCAAVKFVTSLAFSAPAQILPLARACDAAGFDGVALSDHVVHPEKIATPYPYTKDGAPRWQPFTDWPDPWVTAGAIAAVTERLRVVTSIFVLPLRHPVLVAKAVGTAAVLSGGRVALGIGVGWMREEFEICGAASSGAARARTR